MTKISLTDKWNSQAWEIKDIHFHFLIDTKNRKRKHVLNKKYISFIFFFFSSVKTQTSIWTIACIVWCTTSLIDWMRLRIKFYLHVSHFPFTYKSSHYIKELKDCFSHFEFNMCLIFINKLQKLAAVTFFKWNGYICLVCTIHSFHQYVCFLKRQSNNIKLCYVKL